MPAKRVLISIDERLLERIDASCRERGLTRSGYLAQLAAGDLERAVRPRIDRGTASEGETPRR
jgi:metal-responsive CopG/Arc/MetJ family transcriptional regulator